MPVITPPTTVKIVTEAGNLTQIWHEYFASLQVVVNSFDDVQSQIVVSSESSGGAGGDSSASMRSLENKEIFSISQKSEHDDTFSLFSQTNYQQPWIRAGSTQGQLVFWDVDIGEWVNTEVDELFWDDTNKRFGIGINTLNSTLQIEGSVSKSITTKTSDYVLDSGDYTILLDGTSNTITATLPTAVDITGRIYNLKCIEDINQCDIATNSTETIDGDTVNFVLIKHEIITIQSDGSNWWII